MTTDGTNLNENLQVKHYSPSGELKKQIDNKDVEEKLTQLIDTVTSKYLKLKENDKEEV